MKKRNTRKIGGRTFSRARGTGVMKKRKAQKLAGTYRGGGNWLARVVKEGAKGFGVFVRGN